jgi:primosomal protein N''
VNPQFHEHFMTLTALFYSDELSMEEWALLQVHMAYCEECEQRFQEYKELTKDVIPAMAAAAVADTAPHETPEEFREAERRLMGRLHDVSQAPKPVPQKSAVLRGWGVGFAAGILVCVALAGIYALRSGIDLRHRAVVARSERAPSPPISPHDDTQVLKADQAEIQGLHQQLATTESKFEQSRSANETLEHRIHAEETERDQVSAERDALAGQLATSQTETKELRAKFASSQSGTDQRNTRIAALEEKVHTLNVALDEAKDTLTDRERMLALDKDFLTHDRDIRDVIAARDLRIVDIQDLTEKGKPAKAFGRIFYTRDRSLVFYGFDLEKQPGLTQAAAFQAWGSGADQKPVSLGLFYQDDNHQRWVMRFDDPKMLAHLNMVFVTVEPPGGSHKPTGKQFLRAYLQIPSNHP